MANQNLPRIDIEHVPTKTVESASVKKVDRRVWLDWRSGVRVLERTSAILQKSLSDFQDQSRGFVRDDSPADRRFEAFPGWTQSFAGSGRELPRAVRWDRSQTVQHGQTEPFHKRCARNCVEWLRSSNVPLSYTPGTGRSTRRKPQQPSNQLSPLTSPRATSSPPKADPQRSTDKGVVRTTVGGVV